MSVIIEFAAVSKQYGSKIILDKVSFQINQGSVTTLIGPNGAGKTTLAKMLLGLEEFTSGRITKVENLKFGYVPQKLNISSHLPLTAVSLIKYLAPKEKNPDATKIYDFANIDKIAEEQISNLSGGQLQKVFLAATLLRRPNFLVLDEPTQGLDVTSQQEFYQLIHQLKQDFDITIFIISHDLFTVMKNSDQVICLNHHICCSGSPQDIKNNEELTKALSNIGFYSHHHDHKH